jgi:hypothetical protein
MTRKVGSLQEARALIGRTIRDLQHMGVPVPAPLLRAYEVLRSHKESVPNASKARISTARHKLMQVDRGKIIMFAGLSLMTAVAPAKARPISFKACPGYRASPSDAPTYQPIRVSVPRGKLVCTCH